MDETKSKTIEKSKRRTKATAICRETGDHVHYPPTRRHRKRPHHAPSSNLYTRFESISRKVHYGECRKNHTVQIGTTAYDGCGEFVIATTGEDSMDCAACGCHRSFHLEDSHPDGDLEICNTNGNGDVSAAVLDVLKLSSDQFRQIFCSPYGDRKGEVKKETRIAIDRSGGHHLPQEEEEEGKLKRLKTKFTAEQTEKMRNYAEKLQWKVSLENRKEVEEFCVQIGVNQKNFRVWMNNHKEKN